MGGIGPFIYTVRVRYADTDKMGVVYHGRHLEWFESARTELLRAAGLPYKSMEEQGYFLPVIEAHCRYKLPVLYDDVVCVHTRMEELSRLKIRLGYKVFVQGKDGMRAEGWTLHCFTDPKGRPVRADAEIIGWMKDKLTGK
jgi:acyl-CoA thioester hydrolase